MLTAIFVLLALALGFAAGRKFPTVLAAGQAALHFAQAEATAVETSIRARTSGIALSPDGPAANHIVS